MPRPKAYRTLMRLAEDAFVVNKSRFIGHGCPCRTEDEALGFLARVRAEHRDATHNCYAYIIGPNMGVMRYSDDGEPGGTAGMPIIEVMKARGVTDAAVVVTRYFGGILLGAGGLVRAYARGAAMALDACRVGVMHPTARYRVAVGYAMLSRVDYFLKDAPVRVEDKRFTDVVTYDLAVRCADEAAVLERLTDLTEGTVSPVKREEGYLAWPEEDSP